MKAAAMEAAMCWQLRASRDGGHDGGRTTARGHDGRGMQRHPQASVQRGRREGRACGRGMVISGGRRAEPW